MSPTEQTAPPVRDDVTAEWLDTHLATVFSNVHDFLIGAHTRTARAVIEAAGIKAGFNVIDIGCGTGVPAFEVARVVGPSGHVTATDPSPIFIASVNEHAEKEGLTNITTVETSAAGLPFAPASFDAATSHFSVMFFPDVHAGLTRIRDVVRPGGRSGFVAWGPVEENTMFMSFGAAAGSYVPPGPAPDPTIDPSDIPQPMRFAQPGTLTRALTAAGFKDVREESPVVEIVWPGPAETELQFWLNLSRAEEQVAPEQREQFRADALAVFRQFERDGALHFSARIVVASGQS